MSSSDIPDDIEIRYDPPPTLARFLQSDAFIRAIMGPFGSGKSSVCVIEILRRAMEQAPGPDGRRHTRWAVVRNTYRELQDTTRKTFEAWIPPAFGHWVEGDMTFVITYNDLHAEVLFRALDRPEDVRKLLSLELTGAWLNEAREIGKPVFDMIQGRVGRFPPMRSGGPTFSGVWLDTNPPDADHWFYRVFEELKPAEHILFRQPGAFAANAENRSNLPPRYYERLMEGKDEDWVKVFVHGEYGFIKEGRPVFPEFKDSVHTQHASILRGDSPIYMGVDFGLTPAAVFGQRDPQDDQLQIFHEICATDLGAVRFFEEVATYLREKHSMRRILGFADPAGSARSQVDERTPFDIAYASGLDISPAHSNDFTLRREAVAHNLSRLTLKARPALVISPDCVTLRKALGGGYAFKRVQVSGAERFRDVPDKNHFSHVADALQYLVLGGGGDARLLDGRVDRTTRISKMRAKRAKGHTVRDPRGTT